MISPRLGDIDDIYFCLIKVSLLVVVEIGVFPLICGWWLDICSLVSLLFIIIQPNNLKASEKTSLE